MVVSVFAASLILYLALSGQASLGEIAVGTLAAAVTSFFAAALRREAPKRFAFSRAHWAPLGRALRALPAATARLAAVLLRATISGGSPGEAHLVRFEHGPSRDPRESGRRAGAMLYACLAPDSFVVRMPEGRDEVLVHTLGPLRRAPDPRWLA